MRETNPSFIWKLKPIPKPKKEFCRLDHTTFQGKVLALKKDGCLEDEGFEDDGFEAVESTSISMGLSLDDNPISSSLDLTTKPSLSSMDISHNK